MKTIKELERHIDKDNPISCIKCGELKALKDIIKVIDEMSFEHQEDEIIINAEELKARIEG